MRLTCSLLTAVILAASCAVYPASGDTTAQLFHKGGAGDCNGCHQKNGSSEDEDSEGDSDGAAIQLSAADPSSTCLRCHQAPDNASPAADHYVSTSDAGMGAGIPPRQMTPGGDFAWLKKDYRWQGGESRGDLHGHSIVAMEYNYRANATITISPGGSYPASNLSCISCHDPHGNYRRLADGSVASSGPAIRGSGSYKGSPDPDSSKAVGTYRLLAGKNYQPKHFPGGTPFTADPPIAVAPETYNRAESGTDTRVAYGSGMSEWCANCHAQIHNDNYPNTRRHPAGNNAKLSFEVVQNYMSYVSSGRMTGNSGTSYTSMVPFEMGSGDYRELRAAANSDGSNRGGPTSSSNVMCLTCHRAHASCWDSMTRWNTHGGEFIVYNGHYPGINNGAPADFAQGRTEAEAQRAFYDRPANRYATYQRSLCNKCHAKD